MSRTWFHRFFPKVQSTRFAQRPQLRPNLMQLEIRDVPVSPFNILVTSPNPLVTAEGNDLALIGTFDDTDAGQAHTVTVDWGDGSPASTVNLGTVSGTNIPFQANHTYVDDNPTGTPSDPYTITVTVSDPVEAAGVQTFIVNVSNVDPLINKAPTVTPGTITEGQSVTVTGSFIDVGLNDTHTVLIAWADNTTTPGTITGSSGAFTYSATHQYLDDGASPGNGTPSDLTTFTVTVVDDDTGKSSKTGSLTVNNAPPVVASFTVAGSPANENGTVTATINFSDAGTLDNFTYAVDWNDGSTGTLTLPFGTTSASLSHTYLDDNPTGTPSDTFNITGSITDDDTGKDTKTASVTVNNVAPVIGGLTLSSASINEGQSVTITVPFSDVGTQDTFTVTIDWNDGTPVQTIAAAAGAKNVTASRTFLDDGPFPGDGTPSNVQTITAFVTDDDTGKSANATTTLTVNNVAPTLTLTAPASPLNEGASLTFTGSITDPGTQDKFTVNVNWADGTAADTVTLAAGTTTFTVSHKYVDDNPTATASDPFVISTTITDDDTGTSSGTTSITVSNVAPSVAIALSSATVNEAGTVSATVSFTDPGTPDTFTVALDWRDGTTDTFALGAGSTSKLFTHTYVDDGPFPGNGTPSDTLTLSATVTDDDTGAGTATANLTVTNVAPTVILAAAGKVNEGATQTFNGTITDPGTKDAFTVAIDWADGSAADTVTVAAGVTTFSVAHKYVDDNPTNTASDSVNVSMTITDDDTGSSTGTSAVTVNNVAPVIASLLLSSGTINEGQSVTITVPFTDAGMQDTFVVTIDWNDGSPVQTVAAGAGATNVTASRTYLDDGPFPGDGVNSNTQTITAFVTDDDTGVSANATKTLTVNNVAPTVSFTGATINEGTAQTIVGTVTDPGTKDAFTVSIDWADGSATDTVTLAAGTTTFSVTHTYLDDNPTNTPSDNLNIGTTITDDDTGSSTGTSLITINNVAPTVTLVSTPSPLDENSKATATVSFTDPGTQDTFTVALDWRDGTTDTVTLAAGATSATFTHVYLDDTPTGTPSDTLTLSATVTDDDTGAGTATKALTVNNVAPTISAITLTPVTANEGSPATVTLTFSDVGTLDTFTVAVDWADGSSPSTVALPAGSTSASFTHVYIDDNPTGSPVDNVTITASVTDDDTGVGTKSATIQVSNVAPTLGTIALSSAAVNENSIVTITVPWTDPGTGDTFTVTVDWADGTTDTIAAGKGATSVSATHFYLDDGPYPGNGTPTDTVTITAFVTDDDTGVSANGTKVLTVSNVAPIVSLPLGQTGNEGTVFTLGGTLFDPGTKDALTVSINWADGTALDTYTIAAGGTTFSATHVYVDDDPSGTAVDTYNVSVSAADDDGGVSPAATVGLRVFNVAPVINALSGNDVNENGVVTLAGGFSDVGLFDTHVVRINWGDGSADTVFTVAAKNNGGDPANAFTGVTHQYLDDNPTATASDKYTITVLVTDDDTGSTSKATDVTVTNVAPVLTVPAALTAVNENGVATITGTVTDVGTQDPHTVTIDWADGTVDTILLGAGLTTFSSTHQYLDDNPTGTASDTYTVTTLVVDDDTGAATGTSTVVVSNVAPVVNVPAVIAGVNENGTATLSGSLTDPGSQDPHTVTVAWGDGSSTTLALAAGVTTYSSAHQYLDDGLSAAPSDTYTVTTSITDDDTGTGTATSLLTVTNVNPTVTVPGSLVAIDENGTTTLSGSLADPGSLDAHTVNINWNDGTTPTTLALAAGVFTYSATHQYLDDNPTGTASDVYTIVTTVTDDDTGTGVGSTTVIVSNLNPTIALDPIAGVTENGVATATGTVADVGTLDPHTVSIDWADGTTSTLALAAGVTTFSVTHQYLDDNPTGTPSDVYTVSAKVIDDDLGQGTASTGVTVTNANPTVAIALNPLSTITENGVATVTGSVSDAGTLDPHTVSIDWADGTTGTITLAAGVTTFSATHKYLDDNPTATPSDTLTLSATVADDDTGTGTGTGTLTVNNAAPTIALNPIAGVFENGVATIVGSIADAGTLDTHTVTIDWADGTTNTLALPAGATTFSAVHQYLDDAPTGTASDTLIVTATVTDDDTGTGTTTGTVVISNVAPTLSLGGVASVVENGVATLTGTINDVGTLDTQSIVITWGDGSANGTVTLAAGVTTFSVTHQYLDDAPTGTPSDVYTIALTATDDDTGSVSDTTTIVVTNAAPTIALNAIAGVNENGVATVTGTVSDVGTLDTQSIVLVWGDGSANGTVTLAAGVTTFSVTHQYLDDAPTGTPSDVYTVAATITDDDTGTASTTGTVAVSNVAPTVVLNPIAGVLENGVATVTGTVSDVGTLDSHTVSLDWADGTTGTVTLAAGVTTFSATHKYLDDAPTGTASDTLIVTATVTDDDTGTGTDTEPVTITNVAPTIALSPIAGVFENGVVTVTGSVSDAGTKDTFTVSLDWADGTTGTLTLPAGATTFSAVHQYLDDNPTATASDTLIVTATVTDDDTGTGTTTGTVVITNVAPTLSLGGVASVVENGVATLTGTINDVGTLDTQSIVITWGDGSANGTVTLAAGVTTFSATHQYLDDAPTGTASDVYTIGVTATDDDTGSVSDTTTIVVTNAAPTIALSPIAGVNENGVATVTGTVSDVGTLDTQSIVLVWGDGSANNTVTLAAGITTFSVTHQYLDDNPTGTPSDVYTVGATITDDDTGTASAVGTVAVSNVAPTVVLNPIAGVLENGVVIVTGTVSDVGTLDPHTVSLDWADGTTGTITLAAGVTTFSATHKYLDDAPTGTASDTLTVIATVTDDDTGTGTDTAPVTITNVAPTVALNPIAGVFENGVVTVTGSVSDAGTKDTFTVSLDWADGTTGTLTLPAGATTFSAVHQYLDDNPTATASDTLIVTATVTDDDTGTGTTTGTVVITNVAPVLSLNGVASVVENGVATLTGTINDVGTLDTQSIVITWGDGSANGTVTLAAGVTTFSATHQYLDDAPTGTPSDVYTIAVTVTDDDTGSVSDTTTVVVTNAAPTIALNAIAGVNENGVATVTGTVSDVGTLDTQSIVLVWGDGSANGTVTLAAGVTTFSVTHQYLDDNPTGTPSDVYTVAATITDDDTGTASAVGTVVVSNVAPTVVLNPIAGVLENGVATVTGTVSDVGTLDSHTVSLDWADGTTGTVTLAAGVTTFSAVHQYLDDNPTATASDTLIVTATVTDDDTGTGTDTAPVTITNVAPTVALNPIAGVFENGVVTVTGSVSDAGTKDTFTVSLDWADGTTGTLTLPAGATTFSAVHQYLDDNPTATASDTLIVTATVTDDDTGTGTTTGTVVITNVAPTITLGSSLTDVDENGVASLSGTIGDVGSKDAHTVTIAWADGTPNTTLALVAGVTTYSATHQYLDDGQSPGNGTAFDSYAVVVTVTDDDTGTANLSVDVKVNNVAPTVALNPVADVVENGVATLTGGVADVGTKDAHVVSIDWNDGLPTVLSLAAGVTTFSATHQYLADSPTPIVITATVTDDDGGTAAAQGTVTVANEAPTLTVPTTLAAITENQFAAITGTIADAGTLDPHTVTIVWGDGSANTTLALAAGAVNFSATHQYLDDPTIASDKYTITTTVNDGNGGSTAAVSGVVVANVAPAAPTLNLISTTITENSQATLNGSIADVGTLDAHTVQITWGDGSPDTVLALAAGVTTFTAGHTYLDDSPSGTAADPYTIRAVVADDDGGTTASTTTITVRNANPVVSLQQPAAVVENGVATLNGTITDPGTQDAATAVINWGDGTTSQVAVAQGVVTFSATHQYLDDNPTETKADVATISVNVTDDDTGSGFAATTVLVSNAAPTLAIVKPATIPQGGSAVLTGTIADAGTLDSQLVTITWGDGTPNTTVAVPAGVTTFSATHQYLDSKAYPITAQVTDDDLGSSAVQSTSVGVTNVPPSINLGVTPAVVNEGDAVSASGTVTDPGTNDPHTVAIAWGDGATDTITLAAGATKFSATHKYLDGPLTPTISVVASDPFDSGTQSTSVQVNNVNPTATVTAVTVAPVNNPSTFKAVGVDPSAVDQANLTYNYDFDSDGVIDLVIQSPTATFAFTKAGKNVVSGFVRDPNGGQTAFAPVTVNVPLTGLALPPGGVAITVTPSVHSVFAAAAGPGDPSAKQVRLYDPDTGALRYEFDAYPGFTGGVRVVLADVNGDLVPDIITGTGDTGGTHVRVFNGVDGLAIASFFAYDSTFRGGVNIGAGDIDGDGKAEIITGAGYKGGPHVKVFNGLTGATLKSFFAFDPSVRDGVTVAGGDLDGDKKAEIIVGAGADSPSEIRAFRASDLSLVRTITAFSGFLGGVIVAAGDLDGDGLAEIVAGAAATGAPRVRVFNGKDPSKVDFDFMAYNADFRGGVNVAVRDLFGDGSGELITGAASGNGPHVVVYSPTKPLFTLFSLFAFDPAKFFGGVYVG